LKTRLLEGEEVDRRDIKFGIRTVELKQEDEFSIAVNGRRVFAKGANWVPSESLSLVATPEKYDYLLSLARDGEFNMLRVWGGGIYEPETFYDLCDRFGIMVWQDFMYACSMYPDDDPVFMENAEREAMEVVRRLRKHPSLVLWCGNNECQEAWVLGDWPQRAPRHLGERLYDHVLPRIVRLLDPGVPYWPGSPYGGPTTRSLEIGDYHDWYSLPNWRTYDDHAPRFSSEYGFRSVPQMETVDQMISPGLDWNPESQHELWRSKGGGDGWTRSVLPEFGCPETLDDYIMLTQELQATLMRYAVEVYRRRMFETSGSLIWQFDEPWPGATFSLIDYFGRPKAAYYWVRKACSPVLGMFYESGGRTSFWGVNDLSREVGYEATLRRFDHSGEKLGEERISGSLPANESIMLLEEIPSDLVISDPAREFLHGRLIAGDLTSERFYHEGYRRDWILPQTEIHAERVENETGMVLTLVSKGYVHFVSLMVQDPVARFSDNFFDLLPDEEKNVGVATGKRENLVLVAANSDKQVLSPR
jgi:beta-mannosidase